MSSFYKIACIVVTLSILFFMCSNIEKPAEVANHRGEIDAQWETFISHWENENTDGLAKLYTEDAVNVPPESAPKIGRAEISQFYNMLFDANKSSKYTHEIQSINFNGNTATEYGKFKVDWERNDGSKWTYYARCMTYWVEDSKGEWKIKMFLFNNPASE